MLNVIYMIQGWSYRKYLSQSLDLSQIHSQLYIAQIGDSDRNQPIILLRLVTQIATSQSYSSEIGDSDRNQPIILLRLVTQIATSQSYYSDWWLGSQPANHIAQIGDSDRNLDLNIFANSIPLRNT